MVDNVIEKQVELSNELLLSSKEKDTIGEILNISMGVAATTISTLLNRKVIITTPTVSLIKSNEFECKSIEPALGIEIQYVEGLTGSNIMIMKQLDIKTMVNMLISGDGNIDPDGELDEMHISAISNIMNQMMGSSCTALASFFGKRINISIPKTFSLEQLQKKLDSLGFGEFIVTVKFDFFIENVINSEFVTVLPLPFMKELVAKALNLSASMDTNNNEQETPKAPVDSFDNSNQTYKLNNPNNNSQMPNSKLHQFSVQPVKLTSFDNDYNQSNNNANQSNFDLLLGVPLEVTVEIGRTKKQVKEILEIRQGSIIELDKQASDPVDIMVNGQLIAKGDVVVIDDNFGVRITEILSNNVNKIN